MIDSAIKEKVNQISTTLTHDLSSVDILTSSAFTTAIALAVDSNKIMKMIDTLALEYLNSKTNGTDRLNELKDIYEVICRKVFIAGVVTNAMNKGDYIASIIESATENITNKNEKAQKAGDIVEKLYMNAYNAENPVDYFNIESVELVEQYLTLIDNLCELHDFAIADLDSNLQGISNELENTGDALENADGELAYNIDTDESELGFDEPITLDEIEAGSDGENEAEAEDENESKEIDDETEEDTEVEDKESKENISNLFKAFIDQNVSVLANTLSAIYKSGFDAVPHAGILVNNGSNTPLIKLKESIKEGTINNMETRPDEGTAFDYIIMKAICSEIPQLTSYARIEDNKNAIPDIEVLLKSDMVCTALHLQFQSANIDFCTGITSIRKWITETKVKDNTEYANAEDWIKKHNGGKRRLCSFKDVRNWYEWSLRNIITDALVKAGVKSLADMETAQKVLEAISRNIRNVIAVSDRSVGEIEEIKICTDKPIQVGVITNRLHNDLNIGSSNAIQIKQIAKDQYENNNVLTLQIIYNAEKANSSNMFAYEIIDRLVDSGSVPSWDNALLGKKEDGTYFFWKDFMGSAEPYKRCYTIYAGSRSGKGIMTSTLVTSALCDNKHIFYTDGKPENGACLGMIAWNDGKEAYAFDGQAEGKKPFVGYMEDYAVSTNGQHIRTPEEVVQYMNDDYMPKCLFANPSYFDVKKQKMFLGVMRYLKSLQLCATIINKRAAGELSTDDWHIWIFDEMKDMSDREKDIREIFAKYLRNKSGAKEPGNDDPKYYYIDTKSFKNLEEARQNDPGVDYICKWVKWTSHIRRLMETANVISLGKAQANLIFIFQEATWIQEAQKITTIGKVVKALKSTKIVGRNALANTCGEYGESATQKTDWYAKIQNGGGWWAISNGSDIRTASVTLFKPYTVWTIPITSNENIDPNGNRNDQKYIGGYARTLLGKIGMNPADILQDAYNYTENAVKTLGYASSLKEYMYNCSNFAHTSIDASFENLYRQYQATHSDNKENKEDDDIVLSSMNINDRSNTTDSNNAIDTEGQSKCMKIFQSPSLVQANVIKSAIDKYSNQPYFLPLLQGYYSRCILPNLNTTALEYTTPAGLNTIALIVDNLHYYLSKQGTGTKAITSKINEYIVLGGTGDNVAKIFAGLLSDLKNPTSGRKYGQSLTASQAERYIIDNEAVDFGTEETTPIINLSQNDIYGENNEVSDDINIDDMSLADEMPRTAEEVIFENAKEQAAQESLNRMAQNDQNIQNIRKNYKEQPTHNSTAGMSFSEDEIRHMANPSMYTNNETTTRIRDDGTIDIYPSHSQEIYKLDNGQFVAVELPTYNPVKKMEKLLFESKNGTSYEFKKRWDEILKQIKKAFPNRSMINRISINDDGSMIVNGKPIRFDNFLGGQYNIRIEDIADIKSTLKAFPFVRDLKLGYKIQPNKTINYGEGVVGYQNLFRRHPRLMNVIVDMPNDPIVYSRDTIFSMDTGTEDVCDTDRKLDMMCNSKDPRFKFKSIGDRFRALMMSDPKVVGHKQSKALSLPIRKAVGRVAAASIGAGIAIGLGTLFGPMIAGIAAVMFIASRSTKPANNTNSNNNRKKQYKSR